MDYSEIIKRSWQITWRYKALWVLGIFAGISGCRGGGGSGGNSGGSSGTGGGTSNLGGRLDSLPDLGRQADKFADYIPVLIAGGLFFLVAWLVWSVFGIAARGGLVRAVSDVEDGKDISLGEMWAAGFSRWGSLFAMGLLLRAPIFIAVVALLAAIIVPLIPLIVSDVEPGFEAFVPMIGSLCIGLPIIAVISFAFDLMYLIGLRYLMLGGQGAVASLKSAWGFMRARFKDSFVMYLLNGVLNAVSGFVLAIPIVVIVVAMVIPAVVGAQAENWSVVFGSAGAAFVIIALISMLYNAIWGTYTSSLWTLAFRSVTGMTPAAVAPSAPLPVRPAPVPPETYAPPQAPQPSPAPPAGPPVAGYPPPPPPAEQPPA